MMNRINFCLISNDQRSFRCVLIVGVKLMNLIVQHNTRIGHWITLTIASNPFECLRETRRKNTPILMVFQHVLQVCEHPSMNHSLSILL